MIFLEDQLIQHMCICNTAFFFSSPPLHSMFYSLWFTKGSGSRTEMVFEKK